VAGTIDDEVKALIDKAYDHCRQILSDNADKLNELVEFLLANESISGEQFNGLPNGLICLKGGELEQEAKPFGKAAQISSLSEYFEEEFFETKKVVYLPL
jgi:16S rRNA (guanine527-N7)-methyltransferase